MESEVQHLSPAETSTFLQDNPSALFIDCRSEIEHPFVGHPLGAIHVSWHDGPDWDINPHFVGEVRKLAGHSGDRPVVRICRSGNRSEAAAKTLETAGFNRVYNVLHGFEGDLDEHHHRNSLNGWRHEGLPWEPC